MKQELDRLAHEQQSLIEENLSVVHWVIVESINVNESIVMDSVMMTYFKRAVSTCATQPLPTIHH